MTLRIRPAVAGDYDAFARLFPQLGAHDPTPSFERFRDEIARTAFVAEIDSDIGGYCFFQLLQGTGYVRHLVLDGRLRGQGIGRALLDAMACHFRESGASAWCLNVRPENTPAVALYQSVGLHEAYRSSALRCPWSLVDSLPGDPLPAHVASSAEDEALERAFALPRGQLADARAKPERVLVTLPGAQGIAVFDLSFPGAFPFRVARPALARALLEGCRPHARHDFLQLVVEDDAPLARMLTEAGATLRFETAHYRGAL